ncbi:hypothetical protein EJ06DRAFT_526047 [Trichodelitschia bisporula]|uniref:Uncharacterized protein n=1 Tax=Trichodelitschia bisporula TaxID=703511 RepID=A0A6G1IB53_9PEZI|nr:hypothetical protein EJ06DRAFT_526047 [Trichodelitschia bisporula]
MQAVVLSVLDSGSLRALLLHFANSLFRVYAQLPYCLLPVRRMKMRISTGRPSLHDDSWAHGWLCAGWQGKTRTRDGGWWDGAM